MEQKRYNEICALYVMNNIQRVGVETFKPKKVKKSVKKFARRIGISKEESHEFAKTLIGEAAKNALNFTFKKGGKKKKKK